MNWVTSIRAMLDGEEPRWVQGYWLCNCVIAGRVVRHPMWRIKCDTCKAERS